MRENLRIACVIPARAGSKGVPGKNVRVLGDRPLIAHSIAHAQGSRYIDRIIVSTDGADIAAVSREAGAEVPFMRPAELATDAASTIDVLLHAVDWLENVDGWPFDLLVLLHATTPLRTSDDIDACIDLLVAEHADSVFSVAEAYRNPYFNMVELDEAGVPHLVKEGSFSGRQFAPQVFDLNSSIYVWWRDTLVSGRKVILPNSRVYTMSRERSIDIDEELDFRIAQMLLEDKERGAARS
jgi:CMP-N,N'-diacetyllegionaminic acid synthase